MKIQRRRVRVHGLSSSHQYPVPEGDNGAEEGSVPEEQNEIASEPEANGFSNGNGNGHVLEVADLPQTEVEVARVPEAATATVAPAAGTRTLPKRRQRGGESAAAQRPAAPAASAGSTAAAPPVVAPTKERMSPPKLAADRSRIAARVEPVTPAPAAASAPRVPRAWRLFFTYESVFWIGLFILTIATRFWDLGPRAIHHDESLHGTFSRNLYIGNGYVHDPMMHGPLQFHLIALMFWLFGVTDATVRFASVFCGIFVVMSPFFLRKQMGRVPAMVCSFLLFISPSILYFSRMAREDSIYSGMEMIMIVGLWRFISTRRPGDLVVFLAGLSLMFTIKETAYLTVAYLAVLFVAIFALQAGYAVIGALGAYVVALGGWYLYVSSGMKSGAISPLPNIPQVSPPYDVILRFAHDFLTHPLVLGALVLTGLFIAGVSLIMWTQRPRPGFEPEYVAPVPAVARRPARALPSRRARVEPVAAEDLDLTDGHDTNGVESTSELASAAATGANEPVTAAESDEASEVWDPAAMEPRPGSALARYQPGSIPYLLGALLNRKGHARLEEERTLGETVLAAGIRLGVELVSVVGFLLLLEFVGNPSRGGQVFTGQWWPDRLLWAGIGLALVELIRVLRGVALIGLLVAAVIYVTLYTVFFTDIPRGLLSGPFASLGYWMAQQSVARGGQPWYYYFLLIPLYEPVAVLFSLAATVFFGLRGVRWLVSRLRDRDPYDTQSRLSWFNTERPVPFGTFSSFLPLFLVWWLFSATFIYSWAGEKMPWLMIHMVRPAIFLASLFVGALLVSIFKRLRAPRGELVPALEAVPAAEMAVSEPVVRGRVADGRGAVGQGRAADRGRVPSRRAAGRTAAPVRPRQPVVAVSSFSQSLPRLGIELVAALVGVLLIEAFFNLVVPPLRHQAVDGSFFLHNWIPFRILSVVVVFLAIELVRSLPSSPQVPPWVAWNRPGSKVPLITYVTLFVLLTVAWGLMMNGITYKVANGATTYDQWAFTWLYPLLILGATIFYGVWIGFGRAFRYLAVGLLAIGLIYQVKSSIGLSYDHPDVATELAVYVQTSPDVTRTIKELNDYSEYATGGTNLKVVYDSFTSWPMEWYLRDYKNKQFIGGADPTPSQDTPVMLVEYAKDHDKPNLLQDYIQQRYAMRWWFPQEWYMNDFLPGQDPKTSPALSQIGGAINTIWVTISQPQYQATLWKYLTFREPPKPLGSEDMILFIRKDIAAQWYKLQYPPPSTTDVQALPDRTVTP